MQTKISMEHSERYKGKTNFLEETLARSKAGLSEEKIRIQLVMYRDIMAVYCVSRTKHHYTVWVKQNFFHF
jgi:hypothetical protein